MLERLSTWKIREISPPLKRRKAPREFFSEHTLLASLSGARYGKRFSALFYPGFIAIEPVDEPGRLPLVILAPPKGGEKDGGGEVHPDLEPLLSDLTRRGGHCMEYLEERLKNHAENPRRAGVGMRLFNAVAILIAAAGLAVVLYLAGVLIWASRQ